MRLVCSPSITEEDAEAIAKGYAERDLLIEIAVKRDFDEMLSDPGLAQRAKLLATLIKAGSLDIRLALRTNASGIYHEKIGIFADAFGHRVSFLGSANETWSAWHAQGNHESIEVFRDWANPIESERVENHDAHFERLWDGQVSGVDTVNFPEAQRRRLLDFAGAATLEDVSLDPPESPIPTQPKRRKPLPHQLAAIDAWEKAGRKGIFEHATGSGKTFTAITAIQRHLVSGEPAIILVPSQLLLYQWKKELEEELPDATLLLAGAGNTRWKENNRLRHHTTAGLGSPRIVLSTMQTAATDAFLRQVQGGEHLLLVADEVHQIGSSFNSRAMSIQTGAALGLSATPIRYGDPEGTQRMFGRFGPVVPPPITLQDAIRAGRLVEYEYFPHPVHLDQHEAEEWKTISRQITLEVARSGKDDAGNRRLSDRAKMLLIKRSRIAKKARIKPGLAAGVIKESFEPGQSWLVYCEDSEQLAETMRALEAVGIKSIEYHSNMSGDRDATLDWFKTFGGVLVSIKCLDEGIDIPAISHAFILASSQNPRQFIQRRGRVLRQSKGKRLAVIHDAIVIPVDIENEPEQTALLKAEMIRAIEFAKSALNRDAGAQLQEIAIRMGIDTKHSDMTGIEEDNQEE